MATYGSFSASGSAGLGLLGANNQRATTYNRATQNGWAYRLGFWGGKPSGQPNASVRIGLWQTDSSKQPAALMASTSAFTVSAVQSYGGDGQGYEYDITPVQLWTDQRYAVGVATNNLISFAMREAASIPGADNRNLYTRTGTSVPTNPFNHSTYSFEGWITAWVQYQANRTPTAACSSPSSTILTTTPTIEGAFTDADSVYGDKLKAFQYQIVDGTETLVWDSGTVVANPTEQDNAEFSRLYSGSALTPGASYKWRCRVTDLFDTWSSWTAYTTFTIGGGYVDAPTTPTGKQTTKQPTPFAATWKHYNSLSTNQIQVRIKQSGTVIRTSSALSKTVAPDAAISVTWAEAFDTYELNWGVEYQWELRGRDTSNNWSAWSAPRDFKTNSAPSVPTNLAPASTVHTTYPLLSCVVTDADGDTLTVKARIKDSGGTVLFTRTMTRVGSTNQYTYQTDGTDLDDYATYRWDAYSYDGSLYSGEQTVEGSAAKSAEVSFIYAEGPNAVITSPSDDHVFTGWPQFSWNTVPNFYRRRFTFYNQSDGSLHMQGPWVTNQTNPVAFTSAYAWRDGESYIARLEIEDTNNLVGEDTVSFSVDWDLPLITNFAASPEFLQYDQEPSAVRLTWDEAPVFSVSSNTGTFVAYNLYRQAANGPRELLTTITSPTTTAFVDLLPNGGTDYTYAIQHVQQFQLDELASGFSQSQMYVTLGSVVLQALTNPSVRTVLVLDSDRGYQHHDDLTFHQPWGSTAPIPVWGDVSYQTFSGTFTLASTTDYASAREQIENLRAVYRSKQTLCYRDERGRKFNAVIEGFEEVDDRVQFYTVKLQLREVGV